ncbi:hypothetical protein [Streptomyces sp. WM6349]|uniref:hypothetical protein n=1 Tax=Streptomyces sp. WM6349 TaxID=1415552 RepID=UPI0006ADE06C|nr:hypothetical protein [Streptomyces sp. WM6349]KOU17049.1 hypothetical protein ADK49_17085 [Streptomyces sp. WM6349]
MTTVYASAGGNRYHRGSTCSALEMGQNIHDYDCDCWGYCTHGRGHYVLETTPSQARTNGKSPCRVCLPDAVLGPSEDDFGHEPVTNGFGGHRCSRCTTTITHYDEAYQPSRWTAFVAWPCATAVVLGLAPRAAA